MKRSRGFSLLEALIALLVLAVGLLGIASMEAASVYATHVGSMQGLAAVEAQSIAAAMRANADAFPAGGTAFPYNTTNAYAVTYPTDCAGTQCNPDQMAAYDVSGWGADLRRNLPEGNGAIDCLGPPTYTQPQCTITVSWLQKTMAPAAGTAPGKTRKATYEVVVKP